jgi:hypothetical protein
MVIAIVLFSIGSETCSSSGMGRATSASVAPHRKYQGRIRVKKATVLTPTASEVVRTAEIFIVQTSIRS